jgi:monoamine oxidase
MARTPLARLLQRATAEVAASNGRQVSRRDTLKLGGALGLAAAAAAVPVPARAAPAPRRIAIVGGGLAGLACAYQLKQAGQMATVYEASDRVGGRSWTLRGAFADGQLVERGGQLIDQSHTAIRQLAARLGLQLDNLLQAEANGTEPLYHFDGQPYSYMQATEDLKAIYQKLHRDLSAAGYPTRYDAFTPRGQQLDRMSIMDWINESVPGGMGSRLGQLLEVAYTIEYGADASQQSALNLLYLLGFSGQGQLRIFGPSNEKYAIRGGCDQLPARLAAQLQGHIQLGNQLVAVRQSGTVTLTLKQGSRTRTVTADKVVLALPFSILRSSVDFSGPGSSRSSRPPSASSAWAPTPSCMSSSPTATGKGWGATARPSPTPATRTPGTSPGPRRAARAS